MEGGVDCWGLSPDWLRPGHAPTLFPLLPSSVGGRGGNRDQPGASMSRREGSLGKGLKGRIRAPRGAGVRRAGSWGLGPRHP